MFSTLMAVVGSSVDDSDDVADVDSSDENDASDDDDNIDIDVDNDNESKCQAKRWERGDGTNGNIQIRS